MSFFSANMVTTENTIKMIELNEQFWDDRYIHQQEGWDLAKVSPPMKTYMDTLADKTISILIPGCGNAHEASYLLESGFRHITLVDISGHLVSRLQHKFRDTPIRIFHEDFFLHQGSYDLMLEQTFFCTLPPERRPEYVAHAHSLLKPGGKIAGVLFNENLGVDAGPPFAGTESEYRQLFESDFDIRTMESCQNSIPSRQGMEILIELQRKEK